MRVVLVRVVSCGVWHEVVVMCVALVANGLLPHEVVVISVAPDYGLWLVSQHSKNQTI